MIYCFDTSALNYLHDDPEVANIIVGLTASNTIWITSLNVIEASITNNTERRISLLKLQKQLARDIRPLQIPSILLRESAVAYATRIDRRDLSIGKNQDGIWNVLNNPEQIDSAAQQGLYNWKKKIEDTFRQTHTRGHVHFQKLFESKEKRPQNAAALLRHYSLNEDFLFDVSADIYETVTGAKLKREELSQFFRSTPHWPFFFLGWAYAIYARAIQKEKYGDNNAGNVDIWCATYLPSCDIFVTADAEQFKALRLINTFNLRPCVVLRYSEFRTRMIVA